MAQIYHFDLYVRREDKYKFLLENDVYAVEWTEIEPQSPFYLFVPTKYNFVFGIRARLADFRHFFFNPWELWELLVATTVFL